jgi:hypothetical protein
VFVGGRDWLIPVPVDTRFIGFRLPPFTVNVTSERTDAFTRAIGLPSGTHGGAAPPTYMKVVEGDGNSSRAIVTALQIDLRRLLHAEQEFEYHRAIWPGDVLRVERTVSDISTRKGGAVTLVVIDSAIYDNAHQCVGTSRQTLLVRNEPAGSAA